MAGQAIAQGSSDAWPEMGAQAERSLNTGWVLDQAVGSTGGFTCLCSPTSSGYIFSSSGDGTTGSGNGFYALGRAARVLQSGTYFYSRIVSASVAGGVTTVGLSSSLATGALSTGTALTSVAVGVESPQSLAGSTSPAAAAKVHREDGTWAAISVAHADTTGKTADDHHKRTEAKAAAFPGTGAPNRVSVTWTSAFSATPVIATSINSEAFVCTHQSVSTTGATLFNSGPNDTSTGNAIAQEAT